MSTLVHVEKLKKYYPVLGGVFKRKVAEVKAVDNVTLTIHKGECFGLVGESGCGKTTFGKTVLRLLDADGGHIFLGAPEKVIKEITSLDMQIDEARKKKASRRELLALTRRLNELRREYDLTAFKGQKLKLLRKRMQIVYQDPTTSLDPRMLVKDIVAEPLIVQGIAKGASARERVIKTLESVGLSVNQLYRYPHEFSGGQRQRIAIARAIVTQPEFIVLDEPTSAVDVSVRAQLLNLFEKLQKDFDLTYLFVSHDLSVVECISDRVAVMYLGKIVEYARTEEIFKNTLHPYAQALIGSVPIPDPTKRRERAPLKGEVPSPINPPSGCRFHPRCALAMDICRREEPPLVDVGNSHYVACYAVSG
ncbi:MAG: ABC transporter ATP-binding protein [Candidatus Bathyarchaeota archaeon]|jgi:oligopeptide/dipeptide ABC transporter ATP-binding protein|nr:ABC transporter ATP-binding protein [Candidatus Bathyarchaeota archaeon A05DMB-5]MDH7557890.1 ABC transporter ATP-binding protein [Candidatus Bathyarchaeota archaeon]